MQGKSLFSRTSILRTLLGITMFHVGDVMSFAVKGRHASECRVNSRGGHQYMHCTDTCDLDQNLIGPILGP